jgi:hypothetical protein
VATIPIEQTPRGICHHAIRRHFSSAIAAYYRQNPGMLDSEDGRKVTSWLLALMHDVLNTIEEYEIGAK